LCLSIRYIYKLFAITTPRDCTMKPFIKYGAIGLLSVGLSFAAGATAGLYYGVNGGYRYGYEDGINNRLNNKGNVKKGELAPDFHLKGLDGEVHSLSMYRGRPVIVNLWEAWYLPCREEMPEINKFAGDYAGKVAVLAVTRDDNHGQSKHAHYEDFVNSQGLESIKVLLDTAGKVDDDYEVEVLPTTFIIDSAGRVAASQRGMADFNEGGPVRKTIDDLLKTKVEK